MTKLDPRSSELRGLEERLSRTHARVYVQIAADQIRCEHSETAECDYLPGHGYGSLAPIRICLICGMTEASWGPGNQVLTTKPSQKISRDDTYAMRRGLMITSKEKSLLLRKETTVENLIRSELSKNLTLLSESSGLEFLGTSLLEEALEVEG